MNRGDRALRFGIIGCGAIAPTHAGAARRLGHAVTAVADPIESRRVKLAGEVSATRVFNDARALCECDDVDVVCVCTPSGMHADHAIAALSAGKHVIVEKPMDVSLEACDRLVAAADTSGLACAIISQHRFDAATLLARQLIESGEIGRLVLATADVKWFRTQAYYDEGDWRGTWRWDGGGALMNQGIHTVDVLQWLAGGVARVHGRVLIGSAHERIEVEDVAVLSLEFKNGAIGSLVASTACRDGYPARIELYGTDGSILIEGDSLKRAVLRSGPVFETQQAAEHAVRVARGGTASVRAEPGPPFSHAGAGTAWGDAHRAQFQDFIEAIRNDRAPFVDARAGREPVAIAVAAYESARTGRTVEVS